MKAAYYDMVGRVFGHCRILSIDKPPTGRAGRGWTTPPQIVFVPYLARASRVRTSLLPLALSRGLWIRC